MIRQLNIDIPKYFFRDLEQGFEKARETHFGARSFNQ